MGALTVTSAMLAHRIRRHCLQMTSWSGASHIGSCLSVADILAVLYSSVLHYDANCPTWPDRDRLILSKGHAAAALYAVLAEVGFFPIGDLRNHCGDGSALAGHVSHIGVAGVEVSTGSLGHGLGIGVGIAMAMQRHSVPRRVFVVLSDGECDEGSTWEAAMFGAHRHLGSLTAVVDYNKLQSISSTTSTLDLEPLADKWRAFGWSTVEVDGHDHAALASALTEGATGQPRVVIAHTIKGKGVAFMENDVLWHYRSPDESELAAALALLGA